MNGICETEISVGFAGVNKRDGCIIATVSTLIPARMAAVEREPVGRPDEL